MGATTVCQLLNSYIRSINTLENLVCEAQIWYRNDTRFSPAES